MNKRDLKADLKSIQEGRTLFDDPDPSVGTKYELYEVAEHAIERAFELEEANKTLGDMALNMFDEIEVLEALARELVEVLRDSNGYIQHHIEYGHIPSPKGDNPLLLHTPGNIRSVLTKAKEVLGDE